MLHRIAVQKKFCKVYMDAPVMDYFQSKVSGYGNQFLLNLIGMTGMPTASVFERQLI